MSWAVVAWSWDRTYSDAEVADVIMKASRLSDIDDRLTWVVSHEVGRGEFDTVDATAENVIRFGLDRVTRPSHHGVAKSATLVTPRGPGLLDASLTMNYFNHPQPGDTISLVLILGDDAGSLISKDNLAEIVRRFAAAGEPDCVWVQSPQDRTSDPDDRVPRIGPLMYVRGVQPLELKNATAEAFADGVLIAARADLISQDPPHDTTERLEELTAELADKDMLKPKGAP